MKRGRMDLRIRVWSPIGASNAFGERMPSDWRDEGLWRAEREKLSGRQTIEAAELFSDYSAVFVVDYLHNPQEGWQCESEGVRYAIAAVEPNRRRGLKRLICNRANM